MIDAIRPTGWVTLNTQWQAIDRPSFVAWVRQLLAPRLRAREALVHNPSAATRQL